MRASLQNRTAADLIGINVNRTRTISVGIGVAVTAVGGMVFGATNAFNPNSGYDLISRLLAIVILGGMGSIGGAMAAAVLLLVLNDVVAVGWSPTWAPLVFFAALVVVLSFRPQGLFGTDGSPRAMSAAAAIRRTARCAARELRASRVCWLARRAAARGASRSRSSTRDPTATSIAVFTLIFMVAAVGLEHLQRLLGLPRARPRGVLRHRRLRGGAGRAATGTSRAAGRVFALLPFGGLVAGLIAIPVGLIALRTRRHTFVVVTIAIFFIFQLAGLQPRLHRRHRRASSCRSPPCLGRELQPAASTTSRW